MMLKSGLLAAVSMALLLCTPALGVELHMPDSIAAPVRSAEEADRAWVHDFWSSRRGYSKEGDQWHYNGLPITHLTAPDTRTGVKPPHHIDGDPIRAKEVHEFHLRGAKLALKENEALQAQVRQRMVLETPHGSSSQPQSPAKQLQELQKAHDEIKGISVDHEEAAWMLGASLRYYRPKRKRDDPEGLQLRPFGPQRLRTSP